MKKLLFFFLFVAAFACSKANNIIDPTATLQKVWVDYDVTQNGVYGMNIHLDFTAHNLKGIPIELAIFFDYWDEDGMELIWLKDNNGRYASPNGYVGVAKQITANFETSSFTDIQLFMPYDELDVDAGEHELSMEIYVNYLPPRKGSVAFLGYKDFVYTQYDQGRGLATRGAQKAITKSAKNITINSTSPSAKFDTLWVEHNITDENGNIGMIIHFNFVTYNMKDIAAYVAAYFDYNDGSGQSLKDKNNKYNTSGGNVAVFKGIYPGYDTAYYDDLRVFMPYDELDLPKGNYNLSFEAMLIKKEGGAITKFDWHYFTYNKPE